MEKNMILSAKNVNINEQLQQLKADYHAVVNRLINCWQVYLISNSVSIWTVEFILQHHELREFENKGEEIVKKVKSGTLEEDKELDSVELHQLKECIEEQDRTIEALKIACSVSNVVGISNRH